MKSGRLYLAVSAILPCVCYAANNPEFAAAAKLLTAAKNADIQQVQSLINAGADVNYVDSTGLSLVCTAIMNNDTRAVQILQMYGADASQCDRQIKKYKNLNNPKSSSGVFSGLSSTQGLVLSAGAGAAVVGGVLLLTDVFNPSNGNGGGSGSGGHGGGGGGGDDPVKPDPAFTLPYGPLMPNAASEKDNYIENLNLYSSDSYEPTFDFMNQNGQNYLLMMHGYSPMARGYMGQETLRYTNHNPVPDEKLKEYKILSNYVGGGRPINVALVTANGINAASKPKVDLTAGINSLDDKLILWSTMNGSDVSRPEYSNFTNKYYNNKLILGEELAELTNSYTQEDSSLLDKFDFSNSGTVVNNVFATDEDDLLAKIVGGAFSGYSKDNPDYIGFMPNGQMSVFRTGNGKGFISATGTNGEYSKTGDVFATGDTITLFGKTWVLSVDGNSFVATNDDDEHQGYIGTDGLLYINSVVDGVVDTAYTIDDSNVLSYSKSLQDIDYMNYKAMLNAVSLTENGKNSKPSIVANVSVIEPLHSTNTETISKLLDYDYGNSRINAFKQFVGSAYDLNKQDGKLPSVDANKFFSDLGYEYDPIVIFATGASVITDKDDPAVQVATFENAAPLVYGDLNHLFMSIVPVSLTGNGGGTKDATDVSGFTPTDKYYLSGWQNSDSYYRGRYYGFDTAVEQQANSLGVDPWGFAAAGVTDELAVAVAAGAVGAVKSAFPYLNNKQIFTLLALTSDGPYLGAKSNGVAYTEGELAAYLDGMFVLPDKYNYATTDADYLRNFKTVYGYGLINLERATTPGNVYYYKNGEKVSLDRAAMNTNVNLTGVFGGRSATISAPFYDVLTSVDGEMSMPRIWENEFTLGTDSKRGLYMGDVLGDFKVRKDDAQKTQFGNMALSMATSQRPYADNLNGLDNLSLSYDNERFGLNAGFQRYFTDGQSRFSGLSNPVLGLATNAIVTGGEYKYGNWSFGARAFSGSITDESFLQNDPTVSAQYEPLRLGLAQGGQSNIGWNNDKFSVAASFGVMHETDTVLGAQTTGLLNMGNGDTTYVDVVSTYKPIENVSLTLRSTFARTRADATGGLVLGLSELNSNAFAFGADIGNFSFSVSRPLAITDGDLQYAYAKYDIAEISSGKYDLVIADAGTRNLDLSADVRETRLMGAYRHNFGEFTDGALGFIYRINPNNTNVFGNESIFMLKLTHRLGI